MSAFDEYAQIVSDMALLTEGALLATVSYKHRPPGGGQAHHFSATQEGRMAGGRGAPGMSRSSANDGTRQSDDMRRLFNHELMMVTQFRFETYSPDGSMCLTAVIFPFSSTNSTITSANSCTRNLSAL